MEDGTAKNKALQKRLLCLKRVLIAFSGGVDSSFLLASARRALGKDAVLAVTAVSETYPAAERAQAKRMGKLLDVNHRFIHTRELDDPKFANNPEDRCFYCKDHLFKTLAGIARQNRMTLIDATNYSDRTDYRPGRKAALAWGVVSPLMDARLTKDDIRILSRKLRLPTWNLPAQACLASRFPYRMAITTAALARVEKGEKLLRSICPGQLRLRHHGDIARIETDRELIPALAKALHENPAVIRSLKRLGWRYISLDIDGYRTGNLNSPRIRRKNKQKSP